MDGIDGLGLDMFALDTDERYISVVVKKRKKPFCSMSDPADTMFPAVITEDCRALMQGTKRDLRVAGGGSTRALDNSVSGKRQKTDKFKSHQGHVQGEIN